MGGLIPIVTSFGRIVYQSINQSSLLFQ